MLQRCMMESASYQRAAGLDNRKNIQPTISKQLMSLEPGDIL